MTDNLHPVDEIFTVRRDIAKLERREKELKAMILDMAPAERMGRAAEAAVVETTRTSLDTKAVTEEMGAGWIEARSKRVSVVTLKVREL